MASRRQRQLDGGLSRSRSSSRSSEERKAKKYPFSRKNNSPPSRFVFEEEKSCSVHGGESEGAPYLPLMRTGSCLPTASLLGATYSRHVVRVRFEVRGEGRSDFYFFGCRVAVRGRSSRNGRKDPSNLTSLVPREPGLENHDPVPNSLNKLNERAIFK